MSTWPNAAVQAQHAAVSTPRTVLESLVRRATGERLDEVTRIVEGYDNEVYRARTTGRQDLFLRIGRFGGTLERSTREVRAIEAARAAGVPGPEVLLLDTVLIEEHEFPVTVQRAVPGRALGHVLAGLSDRQRDRILVDLGGLIARLNGVPAERDWATVARAQLAARTERRDQALAGGLSAAEFELIIGLLTELAEWPHPESVLCHGDLSPGHVFVGDDLGITGVIDFGDCQSAPPVHDLAIWRVRAARYDLPLAPLLAGYGASPGPSFQRRLDLHTLAVALPSLEIGVDDEDEACVRRSRTLIRRLLKTLQ